MKIADGAHALRSASAAGRTHEPRDLHGGHRRDDSRGAVFRGCRQATDQSCGREPSAGGRAAAGVIERAHQQSQRARDEQRHQHVGHREMRFPHVQDGNREKGRRRKTGPRVGHPAAETEQHDDCRGARERDDDPRDDEISCVAQDASGDHRAVDVGDRAEYRRKQVERQRRPVKEVRIEVAAHDRDGVTKGDRFVGARVQVRQPEPHGVEAQHRAQPDDRSKPGRVSTARRIQHG